MDNEWEVTAINIWPKSVTPILPTDPSSKNAAILECISTALILTAALFVQELIDISEFTSANLVPVLDAHS